MMEAGGNPWSVVSFIAKKDGVQGVLLLILCALIYWGQKEAREDRKQAQEAYKVVVDSLVSSHRREAAIASEAKDALEASTRALIDNTRVLQRVEYRLPRRREDG